MKTPDASKTTCTCSNCDCKPPVKKQHKDRQPVPLSPELKVHKKKS